MKINILISKKGTKVITATALHAVLDLASHHYGTNVKKWLADVYEFQDGIRIPQKMRDYAPRILKDNPVVKDYYLSVELAKMIALHSKSKNKRKVAAQLSLEEDHQDDHLLSKGQLDVLLDLTKAMSRVSCQLTAEKRHLQLYERRNGTGANWWGVRAKILGYSVDALRKKMQLKGMLFKGKTQREMLLQLDRLELIRIGVIDHFMAQGKNDHFARNMGDIAKQLAKELQLEVFDDRESANLFAPTVSPGILQEIQQRA